MVAKSLVYGQAKPKRASFTCFAFGAQFAAVGFDNPLADGQSQTKTSFTFTFAVRGLKKLIEDMRQVRFIYTRPGVNPRYSHRLGADVSLDFHSGVVAGKFNSVGDVVIEDLSLIHI